MILHPWTLNRNNIQHPRLLYLWDVKHNHRKWWLRRGTRTTVSEILSTYLIRLQGCTKGVLVLFCVFFFGVFFLFLEGREASEHRSVAAALVRHSG